MLEVVGVTGVVHMGQIQSSLRAGIRIAQGGHVSICTSVLQLTQWKMDITIQLNMNIIKMNLFIAWFPESMTETKIRILCPIVQRMIFIAFPLYMYFILCKMCLLCCTVMLTNVEVSDLSQLRITLLTDIPVQVDGEPWVQPAGQVVVLRSALKVRLACKNWGNFSPLGPIKLIKAFLYIKSNLIICQI